MVKVSTTAKDKLSALMAEEGKNLASSYVSVGVESGGCSGLSYKMEFSSEIPENAELYEDNGVRVVVEKKSIYLKLVPDPNFPFFLSFKTL